MNVQPDILLNEKPSASRGSVDGASRARTGDLLGAIHRQRVVRGGERTRFAFVYGRFVVAPFGYGSSRG